MKRFLLGIGVAAGLAMAVLGVSTAPSPAATADPDPTLPTLFTYPSTYVVNPDGTHSGCVQNPYGLTC